jgi:hypothetical protein
LMKTEIGAHPPVRSFVAATNAVPSQTPPGSLTKLREVTEAVAYR